MLVPGALLLLLLLLDAGIPDDKEGLFDTIQRSKNHYQKRAYQCIKFMVTLFCRWNGPSRSTHYCVFVWCTRFLLPPSLVKKESHVVFALEILVKQTTPMKSAWMDATLWNFISSSKATTLYRTAPQEVLLSSVQDGIHRLKSNNCIYLVWHKQHHTHNKCFSTVSFLTQSLLWD